MFSARTQRVHSSIEELQPVLAPEALAVENEGGCAEDAEALGLLAVALIEVLNLGTCLFLLQVLPGQAILVRHRAPDRSVGGISLLGPERPQQRVRTTVR